LPLDWVWRAGLVLDWGLGWEAVGGAAPGRGRRG